MVWYDVICWTCNWDIFIGVIASCPRNRSVETRLGHTAPSGPSPAQCSGNESRSINLNKWATQTCAWLVTTPKLSERWPQTWPSNCWRRQKPHESASSPLRPPKREPRWLSTSDNCRWSFWCFSSFFIQICTGKNSSRRGQSLSQKTSTATNQVSHMTRQRLELWSLEAKQSPTADKLDSIIWLVAVTGHVFQQSITVYPMFPCEDRDALMASTLSFHLEGIPEAESVVTTLHCMARGLHKYLYALPAARTQKHFLSVVCDGLGQTMLPRKYHQ